MAFVAIDSTTIEVGDALKKELFDSIKLNFDDHESRLQILAGGSGKINLMNNDIQIGSTATYLMTGVLYVEVIQQCIITGGSVQIFAKTPATSGSLTIDVKKNSTTNPTGFTSVFTTKPTLNFGSVSDYSKNSGIVNASSQALAVGDIIRLDIIDLPVGCQGFRVNLTGEF